MTKGKEKQMQNFLSIQLPRNFNFISRLPARFNMLVIAKGNVTAKGIWYKVNIGKQELNILSKRELKIGKQYVVEKKSKLELVIKEDVKSAKQDEGKNSKINSLAENLQSARVNDSSSLFSFSQYSIALFTAQLISLLYIQEQEQMLIEKNNDKSFYFQKKIANQEITGVFKKAQEKWLLYLALPKNYFEQSDSFENELNEAMFGLPIEKIFLTSRENVNGLSKGIDIFS